MKKSDLTMVILIASITVIISFIATRAIFGGAEAEQVKVKTVDKINATIQEPDPSIFNSGAINPTYEVTVGSGSGN